MNARQVIAGVLVAVLVGSVGVAAQDSPDVFGAIGSASTADATDQIVEGHTVHTEFQNANASANDQGALVAHVVNRSAQGGQVLWFDDSFFHQGAGGDAVASACGGSLWATQSHGVLLDEADYTADKTYYITDPTGKTWHITEFEGDGTSLTRAWAVEVDCADDLNQVPYSDGPFPTYDAANSDPDTTPQDVDTLEWNAILWFEFGFADHVDIVQQPFAPVQFGDNGANSETHDTTEGNSHPYNPNATQPAPTHEHVTAQMNLYYQEDDSVDETATAPDFENNHDFGHYHSHS